MSQVSKIKVECSNGHKFPVNLSKHSDRDYVFCPKCREKIKIKKSHIFEPNPKWVEEKQERESIRRQTRLMRKRREKGLGVSAGIPPVLDPELIRFLLAEQARKREEEKNKVV